MNDMNIKLNPGGLIGALLCGAVALAVFLLLRLPPFESGVFAVIALVGGVAAGNALWARAFKK